MITFFIALLFLHINETQGEGNGTPFQYSCLENPMGGGTWKATVHGVAKSRTRLSDFTFTFHFHALEKEMATHSSVLAWRIPGRGASWAAVSGVAQSQTWLKQLSSSSSSSNETQDSPFTHSLIHSFIKYRLLHFSKHYAKCQEYRGIVDKSVFCWNLFS